MKKKASKLLNSYELNEYAVISQEHINYLISTMSNTENQLLAQEIKHLTEAVNQNNKLLIKRIDALEVRQNNTDKTVFGVDGETSLVNRVRDREKKDELHDRQLQNLKQELINLKKEFRDIKTPKTYLSKIVRIRDLLVFFSFASIWYIKESRDALLRHIGDIIKALGLIL